MKSVILLLRDWGRGDDQATTQNWEKEGDRPAVFIIREHEREGNRLKKHHAKKVIKIKLE